MAVVILAAAPLPAQSIGSPWTSADIGDVGLAGSAITNADGQLIESGAGADIWGTADAFHYVYEPIRADAAVSTIVSFEQPTHQYAKAGVMLRETADPASPEVMLDINPDGRVELLMRATFGGNTTLLATSSVPAAVGTDGYARFYVIQPDGSYANPGVKLQRSGSTVTASISLDGGRTYRDLYTTSWISGAALAGTAVTSHDPSTLNQAGLTFSNVTQVPAPWLSLDVGSAAAVGVRGDAWYGNGAFTVTGAGSDIWGTADAFHAVLRPMPGDGSITARVVSEENTNYFAKAGVMLRQSTIENAATVILDVLPNGTVEFMARPTAGAAMSVIAYDSISFPAWLGLDRRGDQVTAYIGTSASAMRSIGTTTAALSSGTSTSTEVALAVTSHDPTVLNTAVFDNVSVASQLGNLIVNPGFEQSSPPATGPGWVADAIRQVPAKSETNQPHTGVQNGACWATDALDCGLYQDLTAPSTGTYMFTIFANADRTGGFVGANVNGATVAWQAVDVRGFGNYGAAYTMTFTANQGDTIRVWMYSPATPGYVVVDDASLGLAPQ